MENNKEVYEEKIASGRERRRYVRISTVLPVEFYLIDEAGKQITPWLQGFTRDISKGGIRLSVNDLWWALTDAINLKDFYIFLRMSLPFKAQPITLKAKACWSGKKNLQHFNRYAIGLEFEESDKRKTSLLFKYAIVKRYTPFVIAGILATFIALTFGLSLRTNYLTRQNKKLVSEYVSVLDKKSFLEKALEREMNDTFFLKDRQAELQEDISKLEKEIARRRSEFDKLSETDSELGSELAELEREKKLLAIKEKEKKKSEEMIRSKVEALQAESFEFSQRIIKGMYDWIKNRQDLRRGLVLSYEGDEQLGKVCFTYDQALAAIVFIIAGDTERSGKILDFYLKEVAGGSKIYNAYFNDGSVFEYTIHSGPNAWIGLAALCYIKDTGDEKYLPIAREVGDVLHRLADKEGGISGGPGINWYSTEHNLDAYAFFNLLYQVTGDKEFKEMAGSIQKWISRYAYTSYGTPVKRGKGDATIATDTYAWSITSFGPKMLYALKMNPEAILNFVIENCEVKVPFERGKGTVKVTGFDFAKAKNIGRGGVVSSEWTSQMILAFEIMADHFKDKDLVKSKEYLEKAVFYFAELQKMLITSPSRMGREEPCLPYASVHFADTGHGWRTPKGNNTGSLAATAYFLIAYYGYNPLKAEFLSLSLRRIYESREADPYFF